MTENEELFAKGNVGKLLLKFSIPAVIALLVNELYNMVDTLFVGRIIGGNAIGAIGGSISYSKNCGSYFYDVGHRFIYFCSS